MVIATTRKPQFFKIILPGSLQKLAIPRGFLKHFRQGKCEGEAVLINSGKSWLVKIHGSYFKEGWADFARHCQLLTGDFMVFQHRAHLVFDVILFDRSACEKLVHPGNEITREVEVENRGKETMVEKKTSVVDSKPSSATWKDFTFAYSLSSHLQSHKSGNTVARNRTLAEEERQDDRRMILEHLRQSRKPHFFKPFLSDSCQQLKIPKAFLKFMTSENCQDGEEVILKNPHCKSKSWPVKLKAFCFKEGWSNFVRDHELGLGEFVVFRHEGSLVFDVMVFGHSTCEKESYPALHINGEDNKSGNKKVTKGPLSFVPLSDQVIGHSIIHYNQSKEAKTSSSRQASFDVLGKQFVIQRPNRIEPRIPNHFLRSNGITRSMYKVIIRDQKGRSWSVKVTGNKKLGGGWPKFVSANCLKEEDICIFKRSSSVNIRNGGTIVLYFTISNSNTRGDLVSSFVKTLMPFNFKQHVLYVPRYFARLNGIIGKTCSTILRDGKGIQWKAKLKHKKSDGQVYILSDWTQICASNGLKVGDTCTFELTCKGKQKIMEFSLH